MSFNRRDFLKSSALFGSVLLVPKAAFSLPVREHRFPVLQGATSGTATQINIMAAEDISIAVSGGKLKFEKIVKDHSAWKVWRVHVEGLSPGQEYKLDISDSTGKILETRKFSTLNPEKKNVKFALASCMRDTRAAEQGAMWKALADSQPDILFLLGDNVYVDDDLFPLERPNEEKIWRRYIETRITLDLYHLEKLIPTLAIWGDHDFGLNNTYGDTPWRKAATEVFRTLYAQDAVMPEVSWGPGIATCFSAYGQRFFLMDNRSFREMRFFGDTHWGTEQEQWLCRGLDQDSKPGWIFTGLQVFGGYRSGWSYETNHPGSLKALLTRMQKLKSPVLFGSGDVHYSEIMKVESELLGYETLEITSSSIHSNAKEPRKGNKRRIASVGEFNFIVAEITPNTAVLDLKLRSYGKDLREYFEVDQFKLRR